MEYFVISPNIYNDGDNYADSMYEKSIAAVGWNEKDHKGMQFKSIKNGDCIIVAKRNNWHWEYYYLGLVIGEEETASYGTLSKKLSPIVKLDSKCKLNFDIWSANGSNQIPSPQRIDSDKGANRFIIEQINSIFIMEKYINPLRTNHSLILTGAPGTGKTYVAKQIAQKMIFGEVKEQLTDKEQTQFNEQCGFVQFHPSYDYTDFVEGLRPKNDDNGNVGFERKDGVFKEFCKAALLESDKPFVFIIDEINRGEISKIFGELFFSIDPGYRGEKGIVQTQYQNMIEESDVFKRGFYVPENVYIIGTMNDIDRSVESMDFAMRRRFAWKEVTAEESYEAMKDKMVHAEEVKTRMTALNNAICDEKLGLNKSYQIGAAYFLKLDEYDGDFDKLWEYHLRGLLSEYLRGNRDAEKQLEQLKKAYDGNTESQNE